MTLFIHTAFSGFSLTHHYVPATIIIYFRAIFIRFSFEGIRQSIIYTRDYLILIGFGTTFDINAAVTVTASPRLSTIQTRCRSVAFRYTLLQPPPR